MKKIFISEFNELPKTMLAWWTMGLGASLIFIGPILGIFAALIRPMIDNLISERVGATVGFVVIALLLLMIISAIITGSISLKKGKRSWVVWIGFIPALLAVAFLVFMILGEFIFPH
jgi:hypothetical protein